MKNEKINTVKDYGALEEKLKSLKITNFLDIATGRGEFIDLIAHFLGEIDNIVGIDSEQKIADFTAKRFEEFDNVSIQKMDASNLKFKDELFDLVSVSNSIHHFTNYKQIFAEMLRVLKKDMYFIVSEMIADEDQTDAQKSHIKLHHFSAKIDRAHGKIHNETYTRKELKEIVGEIELSHLDVYEFAYPIENSKDEEMLKRYSEMLKTMVEQSKELPNADEIKQEAEEIEKWISLHGFEPATIMFFIGKK